MQLSVELLVAGDAADQGILISSAHEARNKRMEGGFVPLALCDVPAFHSSQFTARSPHLTPLIEVLLQVYINIIQNNF